MKYKFTAICLAVSLLGAGCAVTPAPLEVSQSPGAESEEVVGAVDSLAEPVAAETPSTLVVEDLPAPEKVFPVEDTALVEAVALSEKLPSIGEEGRVDESGADKIPPLAEDVENSALAVAEAEPLYEPEPATPSWVVPEKPLVDELLEHFTGPLRKSTGFAMERSGRYMPMIKAVLEEEGLPPELAYLPMVESHFIPNARSRAGALGLWQFIDTTGRNSGLRVDWWADQRLDPVSATRAAARHLKELYERFNDWELSLAAYNAGPGGVSRALNSSGTDNFWDLASSGYLREETRRYVPKFYAAMLVYGDPERYGFSANPDDALEFDTVEVDSPVDLVTVSKLTGVETDKLKSLNPSLLRGCTPPKCDSYPLRVPKGYGEKVALELEKLSLFERLDFVKHTVRKGDSIHAIARKYRTSVGSIVELNQMRDPRLIHPGQKIVIPVRFGTSAAMSGEAISFEGRLSYVVKGGDSLWKIAKAFDVSVKNLINWNGLDDRGVIKPGDRLYVSSVRKAKTVPSGTVDIHVVRSGETLWSISRSRGLRLKDLIAWNSLNKNSLIRPGDMLRLSPEGKM